MCLGRWALLSALIAIELLIWIWRVIHLKLRTSIWMEPEKPTEQIEPLTMIGLLQIWLRQYFCPAALIVNGPNYSLL
jgi:hypothetical protein